MKLLLLLLLLASSTADARTVRGTLQFADDNRGTIANRPIQSVEVKVMRGSSSIGSGLTNSLGRFTISIPDSVPEGTELEARFQSKNYAGNVYLDMDWVNDRITWKRRFTVPAGSDPIEASAVVQIANFSVHFSILEAITHGRRYADARDVESDDVGQVWLEYPDCEGTYYNRFWGDITLRGEPARGYGCTGEDDGWQDYTVLHEFGHHVMAEISDMDLDLFGGTSHSECTDRGYRFAWVEGWATYFSRTVTDTYPQLLGGSSIEPVVTCATEAPEGKARAILWDLYDRAGGEAHDRIDGRDSFGGTPFRDVLFAVFDDEQDDGYYVGTTYIDPPTSILSFHDHLVAREVYAGSHADIDRIYQGNGVTVHAMASYTFVSLTAPPNVQAGALLPITMRISNPGIAYSDEPLRIRIWSSPTALVDEFTIPTFTGQRTVNRSVLVPSTTPPGTLFVVAQLDPADRFPEVIENDNSLAIAVTVAQ